MQAVIFDGSVRFVKDYPQPIPGPGETLVKVLYAGICRTDIEITQGYMQYSGIPGHEFVGVTETGERVVGEINCGCGECEWCRGGDQRHCPHRTVLGIVNRSGALAEYLCLPIKNLLPVPEGVEDLTAVFVEPVAAAVQILEQSDLKPTDRVLVLGDGTLGQLCAQVITLTCPDTTLVGHHEKKLAIAQSLGINTWLHPKNLDPHATLVELGGRADVVVEATASHSGFELAVALTRPRGTLALKSTLAASSAINLAPIVVDEIKVTGSRCGPFMPAMRLLAKGFVQVTPLITKVYQAHDAPIAFERAYQSDALKLIVAF